MYEIAFRKISTRSLLRRVTAEEQVPIGREFVSHVRDGGAPAHGRHRGGGLPEFITGR